MVYTRIKRKRDYGYRRSSYARRRLLKSARNKYTKSINYGLREYPKGISRTIKDFVGIRKYKQSYGKNYRRTQRKYFDQFRSNVKARYKKYQRDRTQARLTYAYLSPAGKRGIINTQAFIRAKRGGWIIR